MELPTRSVTRERVTISGAPISPCCRSVSKNVVAAIATGRERRPGAGLATSFAPRLGARWSTGTPIYSAVISWRRHSTRRPIGGVRSRVPATSRSTGVCVVVGDRQKGMGEQRCILENHSSARHGQGLLVRCLHGARPAPARHRTSSSVAMMPAVTTTRTWHRASTSRSAGASKFCRCSRTALAGWTDGAIYRVRITIDTPNTKPNLNTERDRGGPKYASLGGGTWSNITPGMTSSSTTLLAAGPTIASHKQRPVSCKRLDGRYRHL
jgi:hypothetical protein